MAVTSETNQAVLTGNGSTVSFPTGFSFLASAEVAVTLLLDGEETATTQTLDTHYTLTGAGSAWGGTVVFVTAPAALSVVTITRDVLLTQPTTFAAPYSPATHEAALDKTAFRDQELALRIAALTAIVDGLNLESNVELVERADDIETAISGLTGLVRGSAEDESVAPDITLNSTPALLLSGTFAIPEGGRTVHLQANGSMVTASPFTSAGFNFYLVVNGGSPSATRSTYFTSPGEHANWSASWIVALPAGSVTIELWCVRASGTSVGTVNYGDFVQFTFQE